MGHGYIGNLQISWDPIGMPIRGIIREIIQKIIFFRQRKDVFAMSKNASQLVSEMVHKSNICDIGDSGMTRSQESQAARANGAVTKHDIASQTRIHNTLTFQRYKSVWKDFCNYQISHGHGTHPIRWTSVQVKDYLDSRQGSSLNGFNVVCNALNRMDDMINRTYHASKDWSSVIAQARQEARDGKCVRMDVNPRAFLNPERVISNIQDPRAQLAAELQLRTGLRANNVCHLQPNNDGTLYVKSKAGFTVPHFWVPSDLYARIMQFTGSNSRFTLISYNQYLNELKTACRACGEQYTGSHALRHNYAIARYDELRASGKSETEAKTIVSLELFHHRLDIIDTYLR